MPTTEQTVTLTHQFLAFQPCGTSPLRLVNANEILRELETAVRRLLRPRVNLVVQTCVNRVLIKVDRAHLEQALFNVAVNALDAMPTGGTLTLGVGEVDADHSLLRGWSTKPPGEFVCFTVKDTGTGMDAATQRRIFEPFFTTRQCGAGLGLAHALGFVNQMGGHMAFTSELGHGSTFAVCFSRVDEASVETVRDLQSRITDGSETILVVENDDGVRAQLRDALQARGYTALTARHGSDALLICRQFPAMIQLMITNTVMPQMSGRQLADLLRALRPAMHVLYLSSHLDDAVGAFEHMDDHGTVIPKPAMPEALLSKVREVLNAARASNGTPAARKSLMRG